MNLKRLLCSLTACILAAALLLPAAYAVADKSVASAGVVSAALGEVGYVEGEREYTKYGEWYGLPNAYWCDMFVSWCAMKGGIDPSRFPRHCSCTAHVKEFKEKGMYQNSAARGGSYIPRQGDVLFFYNYERYPSGTVCSHTGLVLYVENGYVYTIEGNALANRLDYPYVEVLEEISGEMDPPDRVVVNRYPLDAPQIHGYGIPDYYDRTPLELEGFVDLGAYSYKADIFQYVSANGIMPGTSEHTFSPGHGMTRGEFITIVAGFFGLPDLGVWAIPFDDVQPEDSCYSAVMAARVAGLIDETEENRFHPDTYISSSEAQAILSKAMAQAGLPEYDFSFSEGDYSYLLTPYTIRADIAEAFYLLCQQMPLTAAFDGKVSLEGAECPARILDGVCYISVPALQQAVPALELAEKFPQRLGITWDTGRAVPAEIHLQYGAKSAVIDGFIHRGIPYVELPAAAGFLPLRVEGTGSGSQEVILTLQ